ncbi:MAG: helix-turn-helix domain-containing protein [Blautia wexlerae]
MTLGDIIKKYRKENNISMSEFASNCSLSKGYISMLENNINPRNNKPISPTLPSISKVASGMGIELDTLLKMMGNEQTVDLTCEHNSVPDLNKPKTLDVIIEKCEEPSSKSQTNASLVMLSFIVYILNYLHLIKIRCLFIRRTFSPPSRWKKIFLQLMPGRM